MERVTGQQDSTPAGRPGPAPAGSGSGTSPEVAPRVFVGREAELTDLLALAEEARGGRGGLALVSGEPGLGKTRLIEEAATHAAARGMGVAWGGAWHGDGAPPFWPWVQVLTACGEGWAGVDLGDLLHGPAAVVTRLVPELTWWADSAPGDAADSHPLDRAGIAGGPLSSPPHPVEDRFRLFAGVADVLRRAARRRPLLVVLDDLQWADTSSLLLLQFLAGQLHTTRVAVLAAYRDVEVGTGHPLARIVGDLAPGCRHLALEALDAGAVTAFLREATGTAPDPTLVERVHRRTGGNPFFLREVVRAELAGTGPEPAGATGGVPAGVREAIRRRLEELPGEVVEVLQAAAVVARPASAATLAAVAGGEEGAVTERLEAAVTARVMEVTGATPPAVPAPGGQEGRYGFAHDLVRETVYGELDAARRRGLHRAAAAALEARDADAPEERAAEVAHHLLRADPEDREAAAVHAARAGRHALDRLAYEDAAGHFQRALAATRDGDRRAGLLLDLGEAQRRAGDTTAARATFRRAAEAARARGDAQELARAALGFGAVWGEWTASETGGADRVLVELLEEALAALGDADDALRARLLARLARAHYFGQATVRADALSLAALEMARRLEDPATLAETLLARHDALWIPGDPAPRLSAADELLTVARGAGDDELALHGHALRFTALLERGDALGADTAIDAHRRLADALGQPRYRWYATCRRAVRAIMAGRFAEGRDLAEEAFALGQAAGEAEAGPMLWDARRMLARHLGAGEEDFAHQRDLMIRYPDLAIFPVAAAHLAVGLDRLEEAAILVDRLPADLAAIPRDWVWLSTMYLLAEVVAALEDRPRAAAVYQLLAPHARLHAVEAGASAYNGAVPHALGLLAATLGRLEEAADHLTRAGSMHARVGAPPWRAHSDGELARVLLTRGQRGDEETASRVLARARATAADLNMPVLAERLARRDGTGSPGTPGTPSVRPPNVFHRDGDGWTLAHQGQTVRLGHLKGLADIAALLARPGRELHAAELMTADRPPGQRRTPGGSPRNGRTRPERAPTSEPGLVLDGGTPQPVLDEAALSAYRARLADLEEEVDEAEGCNDPERAARARRERDLLVEELAGAVGLGGRVRTFNDDQERARKAVGNRIRRALERIADHHPVLAAHLRACLSTGTFCCYRPEQPTTWRV